MQAAPDVNSLQADRLAFNYSIGDGGAYSPQTTFFYNDGEWAGGPVGYLGVRFIVGTSATIRYGWIEVGYGLDHQFTITRFAYDDTGAPIAAGAIPEPANVTLFLGAAAFITVLVRRRYYR